MSGRLAAAVAAADWPRALAAAIAAWRATRDPIAAHLVDRIGERCERLTPPSARALHAWWVDRARPYDPVIAGVLLDHLPVRLRASDAALDVITARWPDSAIVKVVGAELCGSSSNWLERFAAIETWPDDPRLATVLASWLTGHARYLAPRLFLDGQQVIADRLVALADVRVLPRLEASLDHGAGTRPHAIIERAAVALQAVTTFDAEVAALADTLDAPTELEALWSRAAVDRDARSVLGDALAAAGDPRGTFIALQLARTDRETRRAAKLLAVEWERWLGPDLGAIAVRDGTEFRDGMLEVLRVGHNFTPPWAWASAAEHRELRTVHTVRPAFIADDRCYARLLVRLAALRTLEIDHDDTLAEVAALRGRLPVTRIEVHRARPRTTNPLDVDRLVALAGEIAPAVTEIVIAPELG